jgi:asparagine synthase (glutamine-hydrolysing)
MQGIVPERILQRQDKIAFATPESQLARSLQGWSKKYFEDDAYEIPPMLSTEQIAPLFQRQYDDKGVDFTLWRILNFTAWYNMFSLSSN